MYRQIVVGVIFLMCGVVCKKHDVRLIVDYAEPLNDTAATAADGNNTTYNTTQHSDERNHTDIDTSGDIIITREPESTVSTHYDVIETTSNTWTACSPNPCQNGGFCHEDKTEQHHPYECICMIGYTGLHCQVVDKCSEQYDGSVCKNGLCVYAEDALSRSCECFHGMYWNSVEKSCKNPEVPCFPNPCENDGTCVKQLIGNKCKCRPGYEGENCTIQNKCGLTNFCVNGKCSWDIESNVKFCQCNKNFYWNEVLKECVATKPPCSPNPCNNHGICRPVSAEEFNCSCLTGFIGETCEIEDFCVVSKEDGQLCKNGVCENFANMRKCNCDEGYFPDGKSHECKEVISPCTPTPCLNDGICAVLSPNTYNCSCSEGYMGDHCEKLDYCILKGGNAFCGHAECKNDWELDTFYCSCEDNKYFDYSIRMCRVVDFCPLMNCEEHETCQASVCACDNFYHWDNSTGKCKSNFCAFKPCPVTDLECKDVGGPQKYECSCKQGQSFNGTHCVDGASCVFPDLNNCEQICSSSKTGFSCSCRENFLLANDNKTCSYMGNSTCSNKTCDNGLCVVSGHKEMCVCRPDHVEMGGLCMDKCFAKQLPKGFCPSNECESTDSGFRCKCEGKYILSADDVTCTVRRLCQEPEAGWKACSELGAMCVEDWATTEGYRCQCKKGQVVDVGGICKDVCDVKENQRKCSELNAKCDVLAYQMCKCPPYFQQYMDGLMCDRPALYSYQVNLPLSLNVYKRDERQKRSLDPGNLVDMKRVQEDVDMAMRTLFREFVQSNILNCRAEQDYLDCNIEVQFSHVTETELKRVQFPNLCVEDKMQGSSCLVPPNLLLQKDFLKNVSVKKTDPCDVDIKSDMCGSETVCSSDPSNQSFNCTCNTGFVVRGTRYPFKTMGTFIEDCKDIDECVEVNPCSENMVCTNTIGSYYCSCKTGYRMKETASEGCIEICNPSPCVHGDCQTVGDHDFECSCEAGYNGRLCDSQDIPFRRAWTNTIIVGAVLGGALLVVLIVSCTSYSKLKKKKKSISTSDRMFYGSEMTEKRADSGNINNAYQ